MNETDSLILENNFNQSNAHPRDNQLLFDPSDHSYRLVDDPTPLHSVTNLVSSFFPAFDVNGWANKKAEKEGRPVSDILHEWECNGLVARHLGTFMHEQIEHSFNKRQLFDICKVDFPDGSSKEISIKDELKYFDNFIYDVRPEPYRTEWKIFNDEYALAGTLDLLAVNYNGDFIIYDWKRSRRMGKEYGYEFVPNTRNPFMKGINGLEHLDCTPFNVGCLQQNLYRFILESSYDMEIKEMNLVMLNSSYSNYHYVTVPRMDKEVEIMLSSIKK